MADYMAAQKAVWKAGEMVDKLAALKVEHLVATTVGHLVGMTADKTALQ